MSINTIRIRARRNCRKIQKLAIYSSTTGIICERLTSDIVTEVQ